jgi:GlcNAc-P-P-Und epimerase
MIPIETNSGQVRLLVTGGSGFIGTNVIEFYRPKGVVILNLDNENPRNPDHLSLWKKTDLLDRVALEKNIIDFNPTHVLHLAAITDFSGRTLIDYQANIQGVKNLIDALNRCEQIMCVIFASSMLVNRQGYQPYGYDDYNPATVYGTSKVMAEKMIKEGDMKFNWLIIRPASIWGPWFGNPYKEFFDRVKRGTFFKFNGKLASKTFGFVYNSVWQIDRLLFWHDNSLNRRTFYIGDHPPLNINNWADEIALQLNVRLRTIPFFLLAAGGLLGDILLRIGIKFPLQSFRVRNMTTDNDIELLQETLKLMPEPPYDLKEGIKITLRWMEDHKTNWKNRSEEIR